MALVRKTRNKEEKNKFVIPLSGWSWQFIPHLFLTPQHILIKKGKERMIYDAAYQYTRDSVSINMMTEDASVNKLHCDFGTVKARLYRRIYNLRITHPTRK